MITQPSLDLPAAAAAFDGIAEQFDERFGPWLSVAAQRRAVRRELLRIFPEGSHLLEIGGGTGEDAAWLSARGRSVRLTDASPAMVRVASRKLGDAATQLLPAESLGTLADQGERFDGAFSNFAALNCVSDLEPVGRALAQLVRPGGSLALVVFGSFCPGEMAVELLRGRPRQMFRRLRRGAIPATLGGQSFSVTYHRRHRLVRACAPSFELVGSRAIGLFVPPSAAEPWISRHPHTLSLLESLDSRAGALAAPFGDHILYEFQRTSGSGR